MTINYMLFSYLPPAALDNSEEQQKEIQADENYKALLLELYRQNQDFLNKAILAISSLAIPFLFTGAANPDISFYSKIIFTTSLLGFFVVVFLQILSLKNARDGCDNALSSDQNIREKSHKQFKNARTLDIGRERVFLLSLFLLIPAFLINIITLEKKMSDSNITTTGTIEKIETTHEKDGIASYTPPETFEKSYTPPTSMIPKNEESDTTTDDNNKK